jgi:hypothetical protein
MLLSLSEIVNKAAAMKKNSDKVEWLQKNNTISLRTILKIMYDKTVIVLLPKEPPPYNDSLAVGIEGMLYKETRRLKIFVQGGGYDDLNQTKRENLFIQLLQDVDKGDAALLVKMISQKGLTGLPISVINESFPMLINEKVERIND